MAGFQVTTNGRFWVTAEGYFAVLSLMALVSLGLYFYFKKTGHL
jgi:hypothetical protein